MMRQPFKWTLWRLTYGAALWALVLCGLAGLLIWSYTSVYYGDSPPLSIETSKRFALEEAFDKKRLKTKCLQRDYLSETKNLCNDSSCVIYFFPVQAKQTVCPMITANVDRKAGEVWLSEKPLGGK